jgi:hypothetical protein
MNRVFRGAVGSAFRKGTFEGHEYLVCPVVALVEGVLNASNAAAPELVLAEEFRKTAAAWNGRPVVFDHPDQGGQRISANDPRVLERSQLGYVFGTEVRGSKLLMEAWLDPERAAKVGEKAVRTLERVKARQAVEVSVGVFVDVEHRSGSFHGRQYADIWRNLVPDHLAVLPEGTTGACSIEMGCGLPRAAEGRQEMTTKQDAVPPRPTSLRGEILKRWSVEGQGPKLRAETDRVEQLKAQMSTRIKEVM